MITNLEHLNVEDANVDTGEKVPMPELQHNMKLLVDIAEADIKRLDSNLRQKEDSAVGLDAGIERAVLTNARALCSFFVEYCALYNNFLVTLPGVGDLAVMFLWEQGQEFAWCSVLCAVLSMCSICKLSCL